MKENNIYVVEVARSDTALIRVLVAAPSSSAAKAHVARTMITARKAKPSELLGVHPNNVMHANSEPAAPATATSEPAADPTVVGQQDLLIAAAAAITPEGDVVAVAADAQPAAAAEPTADGQRWAGGANGAAAGRPSWMQ